MKYDNKDFENVVSGTATIEEMCKKYDVNYLTFRKEMNKRGYYLRKKKFKITTPYGTKIVYSINGCAYELKVSTTTIKDHVSGKRKVKLFETLGITIEEIK